MNAIAAKTCVRFHRVNNEDTVPHRLIIGHGIPWKIQKGMIRNDGNLSYNYFDFSSTLNLDETLQSLLHILGLGFEHKRPDRDDWIRVKLDRVDPEHVKFFDKNEKHENTIFGHRYDYNSIMHVWPFKYSKTGLDVIVPLVS